MSRRSDCYHWFEDMGVCSIDGLPCDDGFCGVECGCFLDKSGRPSDDHVFDLHTGKWVLKDERKETV